jgi:hypothetical protein
MRGMLPKGFLLLACACSAGNSGQSSTTGRPGTASGATGSTTGGGASSGSGGAAASGTGAAGSTGAAASSTGSIPVRLASTLVDSTFETAQHMRASREMQLSGEPFAQILGYNLTDFDRTLSKTDQYHDPVTNTWVTDPLGYGLAVESYEYSKQPMNNVSFESGAGLSLMYGPVLNPNGLTGDGGFGLLLSRFQQFALESQSGGPLNSGKLVVSPAPAANPANYYGWPGWWPVFAEFTSFDPAIEPNAGGVNTCTFSGSVGSFAYGGGLPIGGSVLIANYECDYNSLHLIDRQSQASFTLSPDALGYVVWKQGLWSINYWASLQDTAGDAIIYVDPADLPQVGQPGNSVIGYYLNPSDPTGTSLLPGDAGVYLGDIPMEGWQGLTMMEEMDNKAALLLGSLVSSDGATLGGTGTILAADNYSYDSPLWYFPELIAVTETPTTDGGDEGKYFPQPTAFEIADAGSQIGGLSGLIGGFAEAFAITDQNNMNVGGSSPFLATFDGDPFPADDGLPDGQETLHDRVLGVLKIALVDLDRLHWNPTGNVLVDSASVTNGVGTPGTVVTTVELVESILALRNAYRALNGTLQLYSNDNPDTHGIASALDSSPLGGAPYTGTLADHILALIAAQADFLSSNLVGSSGAVANGFDLSAGQVDPSPTDVASEAGAIRGLLDAYLATSQESYRTLAITVYADLLSRFWMPDALAFETTAGQTNPMAYTPIRFAMLSGAQRQYYKLVASVGGRDTPEASELLAHIMRMSKLVLNGWNDLNQDNQIQYPTECVNGVMSGGLEMGERALTNELGNPGDDGDREHDCIREISYVDLPAALGAELDISRE